MHRLRWVRRNVLGVCSPTIVGFRPRKEGDLSAEDRKKLEGTKNCMKSWPITFKDDSSATVDSFRAFLAQEVIQGR